MQSSQNSAGESSCFINTENKVMTGPPCRCGRSTQVLKSWTDDNPGRRFFRCSVHGFSSWSDEEEPHGWQKISLLEAREQIQRQRSEIQTLKNKIMELTQQRTPVMTGSGDNFKNSVEGVTQSEENRRLEMEASKASERERMMRQMILFSWGGFLAATAIILTVSKN